MAAAHSPAALIGPVLEKIHHSASGRKYSKLRQDAKVGARARQARRGRLRQSVAGVDPGVCSVMVGYTLLVAHG